MLSESPPPGASFNSRTPGRVRPSNKVTTNLRQSVSIHAPREGCDWRELVRHDTAYVVSIHAPREGCDLKSIAPKSLHRCFNSRTPGGVRPSYIRQRSIFFWFQFTHPGRGATEDADRVNLGLMFQFTHPGRGATDGEIKIDKDGYSVSIHAPREGCD